ncbi:Stk1 family PASTA domain-containing Ser/Thr kinase [Streptosporangiaceae bacterium NEAU-GS5]|nr:Stk1 family PASTA domain-containing Ser/Thr kinase [Streptosporangiaceae bacterium NEAU-GS5]
MDTTLTDPLIGQLLDGRYRVESRIARGGMASVYLALDVRLDRTVALKVMHRSLAEDPQFVQRFIGEAKSVASLSHPNVVHVFDQGTDGDHVYLSMEHVPGQTLRDLMRERGRLPARDALEIMIPVLAALGAAHQTGLIHRDVKPENILISGDGRVKVADFGLARALEASHQTKTGVMIGTIGYMSPEQVTAGTADARSDVYAAGIMLFEMLTGEPPYNGETPMSVAYRHVHDSVPAPSALAPETPQQLDVLVQTATDRDPAGRYPDAQAMLVAAVEAHRLLARLGPMPVTGAHAALPPTASTSGAHTAPPPYGHTLIQPRGAIPTTPAVAAGIKRLRRHWFIVALAVAMVGGIVYSGWWFSQGRYIQVPDLLGQNIKAAQQQALKSGFKVVVGKARFDEKVAKDLVLDISPSANSEVEKGAQLTLIPSGGPETIPVPKVENLSEADARVKLADAGLTVSRVSKSPSDTVARGLVIKTDPIVGKRVRKGSAIKLIVSMGLVMPDMSGLPRDQAEKLLSDKGFQVSIDEVTDDHEPGTVIAQDPAGGTPVEAGVPVHLTVSTGPETGFQWPWDNNDGSQPQPDFVNVPDVRLKSLGDATRELQAAGFGVKARKLFGGQRVVGERPTGQAPQGSKITIWY